MLKNQEFKRSMQSKASKAKVNSLSNSSNTSNSSVNKDWENWVVLHGKKEVAVEDVKEIGKTLGVNFLGDKNNRFNLLSKEGRREWREERGSLLLRGGDEDELIDAVGC